MPTNTAVDPLPPYACETIAKRYRQSLVKTSEEPQVALTQVVLQLGLVEAERSHIAEVARTAVLARSSQTDILRGTREALVLTACPLPHSAKAPRGATYIIGMPKVDLLSEHMLAPDA